MAEETGTWLDELPPERRPQPAAPPAATTKLTGTWLDELPPEKRPALPPTWEEVADKYKEKYPNTDQSAIQNHYELSRKVAIARRMATSSGGENAGEFIERRMIPFVSTGVSVGRAASYGAAAKRIAEGNNPSPEDIRTVAEYERQQQLESEKGFAAKLGGAAAHLPAIVGEFATGGAILKEAAARGGGAWLAKEAAEQGAKVAVPKLVAQFAARTAATTALVPSMYAERWVTENMSHGRDPMNPKGFPNAFALGMIQTAALDWAGSLARAYGPTGTGVLPMAGRVGVSAPTATGFAAGADFAHGKAEDLIRKVAPDYVSVESHYGPFGEIIKGKWGPALKDLAITGLTFAALGVLHDHPTPQKPVQTLARTVAELQGQGLSNDAIAARLNPGAEIIRQALEKNPSLTRQEAMEAVKDMPKGPARDFAEAQAAMLPEKATQAAPAAPAKPAAQESQPAQPAAPEQPQKPAEPFADLTDEHLKDLAKVLDIKTTGKRADILKRILENPAGRQLAEQATTRPAGSQAIRPDQPPAPAQETSQTVPKSPEPSRGVQIEQYRHGDHNNGTAQDWKSADRNALANSVPENYMAVFRRNAQDMVKNGQASSFYDPTTNKFDMTKMAAYEKILNEIGYEMGSPEFKKGTDVVVFKLTKRKSPAGSQAIRPDQPPAPAQETSQTVPKSPEPSRGVQIEHQPAQGPTPGLEPPESPPKAPEAAAAPAEEAKPSKGAKPVEEPAKQPMKEIWDRYHANDNITFDEVFKAAGLTDDEIAVVKARMAGMSFRPIGKAIGKTGGRAKQLEQSALAKLELPEDFTLHKMQAQGAKVGAKASEIVVESVEGNLKEKGFGDVEHNRHIESIDSAVKNLDRLFKTMQKEKASGELTPEREAELRSAIDRNKRIIDEGQKAFGSPARPEVRPATAGGNAEAPQAPQQGREAAQPSAEDVARAELERPASERLSPGGFMSETGASPLPEKMLQAWEFLTGKKKEKPEVTALANRFVDAERRARGREAIIKAASISDPQVAAQADAEIARNPDAAKHAFESLEKSGRPATPVETMLLLRHKTNLENQRDRLSNELQRGNQALGMLSQEALPDHIEKLVETKRQYDDVVAQMDRFDAVASKVGSEAGRAFRLRRLLMGKDYSLEGMLAQARAAKGGQALTEAERSKLEALHAEIADLRAKLSELEEASPTPQSAAEKEPAVTAQPEAAEPSRGTAPQAGLLSRVGKWLGSLFRAGQEATDKPKSKAWEFADRLEKEALSQLGEKFGDNLFHAGFDPTVIAPLSKYVAAKIIKGGLTFADFTTGLVNKFGDDVKPHLKEIWKQAQEHVGNQNKPIEEQKSETRVKLTQANRKVKQVMEDVANSVMTPAQRIFRAATGTWDLSRVIMTAFDLSSVLRQGAVLTMGHPIKALKNLPDMIRSFGSEVHSDRVMDRIRNRANAINYERAGLYLADPDAKIGGQEEAFIGRLTGKIPGLAGSERAFNTFLNLMRADVFDSMTASMAKGGRASLPEQQAIAHFINVATGRGNLPGFERSAVALSRLMFSPRFLVSRFQLLVGSPLWYGNAASRKAIAMEYGRAALGLAAFYGLMALNKDSEFDFIPTHTDFGKVKIGNTRIDPLAGMAQVTRYLSRIAHAGYERSQGEQFTHEPLEESVKFGRSKLAPVPGGAINLLTGKNVVGQPVTAMSQLDEFLTPMAAKDVMQAMKEQGATDATITSILTILGMGAQTYERGSKKREVSKGLIGGSLDLLGIENNLYEAPPKQRRRRSAGTSVSQRP